VRSVRGDGGMVSLSPANLSDEARIQRWIDFGLPSDAICTFSATTRPLPASNWSNW
jgi:hypothetical protein